MIIKLELKKKSEDSIIYHKRKLTKLLEIERILLEKYEGKQIHSDKDTLNNKDNNLNFK